MHSILHRLPSFPKGNHKPTNSEHTNPNFLNFFDQLHLNLHETDLLFRYLSHHLTWHCLLIYGFSPFLFVAIIKLFCTDMKIKTKMF